MDNAVMPGRIAALENVPHAIPYQGSKRRLAHAIVPLLPSDTGTLVEPFAGSAAVTIAAQHLGIPRAARICDINEPLIALWVRILDEPAALADDYERLWHEQRADPRAYYDEIRAKFNATGDPQFLLYLLARCVKAAVRYNRDGAFNQGADQRRLGAKPDTMRARLIGTSRTLNPSTVATVTDYPAMLLGAAGSDVVYLDPPYQGVSRARDHRYMAGLDHDSFLRHLAEAVAGDVSFLLSYDGSTGAKRYGRPLPGSLNLLHLHLYAGKSTQATLNGLDHHTVESLYVSPALVDRLGGPAGVMARLPLRQAHRSPQALPDGVDD
ncbi:DNA adenine methylase [Krasilnikovia sp. M28-CT-15]|uniref:DNA adenine methylase n=1 Tax=Krasilnikovia sp. M28-CT-15 TaxID=3373540 RepID=UPI00387670C4